MHNTTKMKNIPGKRHDVVVFVRIVIIVVMLVILCRRILGGRTTVVEAVASAQKRTIFPSPYTRNLRRNRPAMTKPVDRVKSRRHTDEAETMLRTHLQTQLLAEPDKRVLMDLLKTFLQLAEELKLDYFVHGGTLLGSWRHHGFIPWDDDIDVLVNKTQKRALLNAMANLKPTYTGEDGKPIIKFFSKRSWLPIRNVSQRWPFMDVLFFDEDKDHIWDTLAPEVKLKKIDVFPLHKRPFEDTMVQAPRNTPVILIQYFGVNTSLCVAGGQNHRLERPSPHRNVSCGTFRHVVPFVHRRFIVGSMEETLRIGSQTIQTFMINEPRHSWTPPFSFKPENPP